MSGGLRMDLSWHALIRNDENIVKQALKWAPQGYIETSKAKKACSTQFM